MKLSKKEIARYNRQILLDEIGEEGQLKLKSAKILVIGAGGLGCPLLLYLAGAGVGTIGIVDYDNIDESNLQRQILFDHSAIGENKADEGCKKLNELNPGIQIISHPVKLDVNNSIEICRNYDLIIDGSDNFETRYLVNDTCVLLNIPLVHGSIFKFEGQVSVFNFDDGPTYRCLFPEPPQSGTIPSCNDIGVLGVLPGIIGMYMANEILKIILGIGKTLSGTLLLYNALDNSMNKIKVSRNENLWRNMPATQDELAKMNYETFCQTNNQEAEIDNTEFIKKLKDDILVVDIRETHELPEIHDFTHLKIPMSSIDKEYIKIGKEKECVILCQNGIRSLHAVQLLKTKYGYKKLKSLKKGIVGYYKEK